MTLPMTPQMIEAAYGFLRTSPPFNRWKLPPAGDVVFKINRKLKSKLAQYQWLGDRHSIAMCAHGIGHTDTLMRTLAHEMVHLDLEQKGLESRGHESIHNAAFRKRAARVCKYHGWDPKAFC